VGSLLEPARTACSSFRTATRYYLQPVDCRRTSPPQSTGCLVLAVQSNTGAACAYTRALLGQNGGIKAKGGEVVPE
jgi:hypothetical protein